MIARSMSRPSPCAEGFPDVVRSSSYIPKIKSNSSPDKQCSSLQALKNQRLPLQVFNTHRSPLSSQLAGVALLSILFLLAHCSNVAQSRSIAALPSSRSSQQQHSENGAHSGIQDSAHDRLQPTG